MSNRGNETARAEKKMGLERFLQIEPQRRGIAAILRSKYASQVHTLEEWKKIVEDTLNRKVTN